MDIETISITPFEGQKPGTSGLRKQTRVFEGEHYLESYLQATFQGIGGAAGKTLILGGDGRYFNDRAAQTFLAMAAAEGVARVIVGQNALLSTPAASHLIRLRGADGGLILSASHNPGGPEGDVGVKFNGANCGPAPEAVTEKIYAATQSLSSYKIARGAPIDLSQLGESKLGDMVVEVVDPVADYAALMAELFDFDA
ncbi:MAG: alpha-D-glucose phosphate-specific phosphoglucomutase, partial [Pseudomonadota bacterium]